MDLTRLDTPLIGLMYPSRLEKIIFERGLETVRDLVMISPSAVLFERNFGVETLRKTDEALRALVGDTWCNLHDRLTFGTPERVETAHPEPALSWRQTLASLPAPVLALPVRVALPLRLSNALRRIGIETLDEAAKLEHVNIKSVGKKTLAEIAVCLERVQAETLTPPTTWHALFSALVARLPARPQWILRRRAGLGRPHSTLEAIGRKVGITRERVRQMELQAIERLDRGSPWLVSATRRLADAVGPALLTIAELRGRDAFFQVSRKDEEAFVYFVNQVVRGPVIAVRTEGAVVVSPFTRAEIRERRERLRKIGRSLPFPLEKGALDVAIAERLGWDVGISGSMARLLGDEWRRSGGSFTGYGERRMDTVLAFLRARTRPVRTSHILRRFGRGKIPEEVVYVDGSRVTLPEHLLGWASWEKRLGDRAVELMHEYAAERHWTAGELVAVLRREMDLPPWCNAYSLGSLLRRRTDVRYLGYNAVTVSAVSACRRPYIVELAERLLIEHKGPMFEADLVAKLRARRGFALNTWNCMRHRRPLVRFADGSMGLSPRDVSGGAKAIALVVCTVEERLRASLRRVRVASMRSLLVRLGPIYAAWDLRMLGCVLRHDERFHFTRGHRVGLAEWRT